jgi:hypothetical protein
MIKPRSRLVDFELLGTALYSAAGYGPDYFPNLLAEHGRKAATYQLEGDAFASCLVKVIGALAASAEPAESFGSINKWGRVASDPNFKAIKHPSGDVAVAIRPEKLLEKLRDERSRNQAWGADWLPASTRALSDALVRTAPLLEAVGLDLHTKTESGRTILIFGARAKDCEEIGQVGQVRKTRTDSTRSPESEAQRGFPSSWPG